MNNKSDKLVNTLISATEEKEIRWTESKPNKEILNAIDNNRYIQSLKLDDNDNGDDEVYIIKYTTNTRLPMALEVVIVDTHTNMKKEDKILLIIYNDLTRRVLTVIDESEVENAHRLWTLFKMADRNAKGADRVIENLINKYTKYPF